MPASMMRAPTGGNPKVMGNSMAMVATVPMPGRTPTNVPTSAPRRQNRTLKGLAATWKPIQRLPRSSDMTSPPPRLVEARPELEWQIEEIDEQHHAKQRHRRRAKEAFKPAHLGRSEYRDHERKKGCGN